MAPRRRLPAEPDELLIGGALSLGLRLAAEQVAAFRTYREEILRWSPRTNLTALADAEAIVRDGFLDSLACAPLIPPEANRVLDIGSGAGFPALPLKLLRPSLSFTLVEASRKKATFLLHIVRTLRLMGVRVLQERAEVVAEDPGEIAAYDVALARAVAQPPEPARLVRPFLRPGGVFLLQVGRLPEEAWDRLRVLGFEFSRELLLPPALGRPGRRVLVARRLGSGSGDQCFT